MKKIMKIAMIALALVVFVGMRSVYATPMIELSSNGETLSFTDTDGDGVVAYMGPVGTFIVNNVMGTTKPLIGETTRPELDLMSGNVGIGTITMKFTETDFELLLVPTYLKSLIGGTTAGFVNLKTYIDPLNNPFGETILLADLGPFGTGAGSFAFSDQHANMLTLTGPFSLTIVAEVTHNGNVPVMTSFDAQIVPEPATLILLGSGLLGITFYIRRRKV